VKAAHSGSSSPNLPSADAVQMICAVATTSERKRSSLRRSASVSAERRRERRSTRAAKRVIASSSSVAAATPHASPRVCSTASCATLSLPATGSKRTAAIPV
jgi:hypothetical protein